MRGKALQECRVHEGEVCAAPPPPCSREHHIRSVQLECQHKLKHMALQK